MPRIVSFRLLRLWVAFTLNDYGQPEHVRLGFFQYQARHRTVRAVCAQEEP